MDSQLSPRGSINWIDIRSNLIFAVIVGLAAALTWSLDHIANFGLSETWQLIAVTMIGSVLKLVQTWLRGKPNGPGPYVPIGLVLVGLGIAGVTLSGVFPPAERLIAQEPTLAVRESSVLSAAPKPRKAVAPELALPLSVRGDVGSFIKVSAVTNGAEVRWFPASSGLNVFPGELLRDTRSTVVTATNAGQYRLIAYTALGDMPSDPAETLVVVGNAPAPAPTPGPSPNPQPGPNPNPVPPPPVTIPDGKYKLGATTYDAFAKAPVAVRLKAKAIADNYDDVAGKIAMFNAGAGGIDTISGALSKLQELNRATLGSDLSAATPSFEILQKRLLEIRAAGSFGLNEHMTAFQEIAVGLRAVPTSA